MLLGALGTTGPAVAAPAQTRWGVRVVRAGNVGGLLAVGGRLYARLGLKALPVRLDPRTGAVVARAAPGFTYFSSAFAGDALWLTGVPTTDPAAPFDLVKLNPTTLRREAIVGLGTQYKPLIFGGPGGGLWSATGWGQLGACIIRRLDSTDGATLMARRLSIPSRPAGGCSGESFVPDGGLLFVVTGSGETENLVLYELATGSLRVVARRTLPDVGESLSVTAAPTRIWLAGGDPGTNGVLVLLSASTLRILAESESLWMPGSKVSFDLPVFSQWPDVTLSAGRIWVGSDGTDACFDPSSRRTLAIYTTEHPRPLATGDFTSVDGRLWAVGENASGSQVQDLVLVTPPRACVR